MFYTAPSRNKFITTEQHALWALFPRLTSPFPHGASCNNFQNKLHAPKPLSKALRRGWYLFCLRHAAPYFWFAYLSHHVVMSQNTNFLFPKPVSIGLVLLTQSASVQETVLRPMLSFLPGIPCPPSAFLRAPAKPCSPPSHKPKTTVYLTNSGSSFWPHLKHPLHREVFLHTSKMMATLHPDLFPLHPVGRL